MMKEAHPGAAWLLRPMPYALHREVAMTTQVATARALKEWAAIVHALLEGEQIVDVRKGGLHEDGRHFGVAARRCWLSPTAEHQKPELLKAAYAHWVDLADASPVGQPVSLHGWADIVDIATITEPGTISAATVTPATTSARRKCRS